MPRQPTGCPSPAQDGNVLRFGNWTIIRYDASADRLHCEAMCACGLVKTVRLRNLLNGDSTGCGECHQKFMAGTRVKHGMTDSPEYLAWGNMKHRCYNPSNTEYHNYGGRGIKVCERWRKDFAAFFADLGPRPSAKHSLDRVNSDGDYEPGNCRWATAAQQTRNTSQTRLVTFRGETLCLKDWAARFGLGYCTLRMRLTRGMAFEEAVSVKKMPRGPGAQRRLRQQP